LYCKSAKTVRRFLFAKTSREEVWRPLVSFESEKRDFEAAKRRFERVWSFRRV